MHLPLVCVCFCLCQSLCFEQMSAPQSLFLISSMAPLSGSNHPHFLQGTTLGCKYFKQQQNMEKHIVSDTILLFCIKYADHIILASLYWLKLSVYCLKYHICPPSYSCQIMCCPHPCHAKQLPPFPPQTLLLPHLLPHLTAFPSSPIGVVNSLLGAVHKSCQRPKGGGLENDDNG